MRKNHEIIKYIFSDKEISKDEKFIFFSILSIINEVNKVTSNVPDEQVGINIIVRALEEPMRQIAANAGLEGSVIIEKV